MASTARGRNLEALGFATDAATEKALRDALSTRRARIVRSKLAKTIEALAESPAVKAVVVDTEGAHDAAQATEALLRVCRFDTKLILIGARDDAEWTRTALASGASDYLVKPVSAAAVREALANALGEESQRNYAGRIAAFTGARGCGTATLVAHIARNVSAGGAATAIVDFGTHPETLEQMLGARPEGDLDDALEHADERDPPFDADTLRSISGGASVASITYVARAARTRPAPPPGPGAVGALLSALANRAQTVLAIGLEDPDTRIAAFAAADARVVLFEPALASIAHASALLGALGAERRCILVESRARARRTPLAPGAGRYALGERSPDISMPHDAALASAATGGARDKAPGRAYRQAVLDVTNLAVEAPAQGAK